MTPRELRARAGRPVQSKPVLQQSHAPRYSIVAPCAAPPPFTGPITRHLAYHLWPSPDRAWRWNVAQLLRRIDLFNGRRLISVAIDGKTENRDAVLEAFCGHDCEFHWFPNNHQFGEHVAFEPLLSLIAFTGVNEVVFRGHAKGGTHASTKKHREPWDGSIIQKWAETMYAACLDDWPAVETALNTKAFAGPFRRNYKLGRTNARWFFSGSFYWFRPSSVFAADWRSAIPKVFLAAEAFPGSICQIENTACLIVDDSPNLYSHSAWKIRVDMETATLRKAPA